MKKKRTFRGALGIILVGSSLGAAFLLLPRGEENGAPKRGTSEVWMEEVRERLQESACAFPSTSERRAFSRNWREALSIWRARARLDSSGPLEGAYEIQGWLSCDSRGSMQGRAEFEAARAELLAQVQSSVALEVARLRRAQIAKHDEDALHSIERLQRILSSHQGEVSERLRRMAAMVRSKKGSTEDS